MHVNDRGQLVTSSNLNMNLEFNALAPKIADGGKIYSKYVYGESIINLPSIDKLMNNVTEFTFSCWLSNICRYPDVTSRMYILRYSYILLMADPSTKKLIAQINFGNEMDIASFYDGGDPWKHIAIVSHNGKITFYINGIRQIDVPYQECNSKHNEIFNFHYLSTDDACLILNQAVWTDNFTPPEEPLLGELKYKTKLWPENTATVIADPGDLLVKLY